METEARVYHRIEGVIHRRVGAEGVLVPVTREAGDLEYVFSLNPVGAFVWDRLETPATLDALAEAVAASFDVAADEARNDVAAFLDQLDEAGLLQAPAGEAAP
jgi:hypothetical protein